MYGIMQEHPQQSLYTQYGSVITGRMGTGVPHLASPCAIWLSRLCMFVRTALPSVL